MTSAILACLAFWLVLGTLWLLTTHPRSALYTAAFAAALWAEVQARVEGL